MVVTASGFDLFSASARRNPDCWTTIFPVQPRWDVLGGFVRPLHVYVFCLVAFPFLSVTFMCVTVGREGGNPLRVA